VQSGECYPDVIRLTWHRLGVLTGLKNAVAAQARTLGTPVTPERTSTRAKAGLTQRVSYLKRLLRASRSTYR